jgi:tRNA-dihydrouridine synthase B
MLTLGANSAHPVVVDPPLFLAPMAGLTDCDFRLIVRRIGGVGLVAMEFISSKNLMQGDKRTRRLLAFSEEERPLAIQIYGSDAQTMADAARVVEDLGADVCDINMGCPANKVLKGCAGAALMGQPRLAAEIVGRARKATTRPLTVKFRLGLAPELRNFLELGRICQEEGADAVAMHARTAAQGFQGTADWSYLAELKASLRIPVIGNGDVREPEDALRLLRETGCDGVMVGRGATRNPWIFRQIASRMGYALGEGGAHGALPSLEQRKALILDHFRTVIAREEPKAALHKVRSFTQWYSHGLPEGTALRRRIGGVEDAEGFVRLIEGVGEPDPAATGEREAA